MKAQLRAFTNPDGARQLRVRLQALPSDLAAIGTAFLENGNDKRRAVAELSEQDRARVFAALFPGFAEHVESGWRLQERLPYQTGLYCKAFRAPRHPEYTVEARIQWLVSLLQGTRPYRCDLDFLTVWGAHLDWGAEYAAGLLLAGVLDSDHPARERTFDTLVRIMNGEHEFATPSRHAILALLSSSRPEGWEVVERLLLAAQREEGLRHAVLTSIDFAHRDAFIRMLRLIVREQLGRFAAVAFALSVWFGIPVDSGQAALIENVLAETLENFEDPATRASRIRHSRGQSLYLALWAEAFDDVSVATDAAAAIAREADFERRYAAVHLLAQLATKAADRALRFSLGDADLRIAIKATEVLHRVFEPEEIFAALQNLLPRVPDDETLQPAIWEWNRIRAKRSDVAAKLIAHRGDLPFSEWSRYVSALEANQRHHLLEERKERELAFLLLGDPSISVRRTAIENLAGATLTAGEAESLEPLLASKKADIRAGVMRLLLGQSPEDCRASVARLSNSADLTMRQAAEVLREELEPKSVPAASLLDGLGLFDPEKLTRTVERKAPEDGRFWSPGAERLLRSLEESVEQHPDRPPGSEWDAWWADQSSNDVELMQTLCADRVDQTVREVLLYLMTEHGTAETMSTLLDAVEAGQLFVGVLVSCLVRHPEYLNQEIWQRYQSFQRGPSGRPDLHLMLVAYRRGVASEADVYHHLLSYRFHLSLVTKRKPHKLMAEYPELAVWAAKCRDRILEVELQRGDLPTAASELALYLSAVFGAKLAATLLRLLGKDSLQRGFAFNNSRSVVLSHLLRVCVPVEGDTAESFAGIPRQRLVELALYAPQWAPYAERASGVGGLEEAAWWVHAHTKDQQWVVEEEIREMWFAEVSERTPLSRQELLDGAVDVEWFYRMRERVSANDWRMILKAAKFAAGGAGYTRAQLFAETLCGEVSPSELATRMNGKRNQDAARAIGLAPLPAGDAERRAEMLGRYELLQEFVRGSRKFGAQRRASEKLAASIGLTNLARTAGYADPQRLSWAMEAVADPDLSASQRKQQNARMRQSLEEAMIRGDHFTDQELVELAAHPVLGPMVAALVFTVKSGEVRWHAEACGEQGTLRIAHPVDLLHSGQWPERQRECLQAERQQPFKQVFREVYVLTQAERDRGTRSGRYEGQQVNPSQALALLGTRGWVNVPDEGVRRTFHNEDLSVWVTFLNGWLTPALVDGLTVEHVVFTRRSDGKVVALEEVNPRIFSEAMRDLDLMVSVAHRSGVDPEATASTVEMRSALLRETLDLLQIGNVRLEDRFAFVKGKFGGYKVHLGSGTVHRTPGGSLCILPVHSQHRGRLFLPFADNDPKTAEIVSKVLMLAQDHKIKDPSILEQLR